MAKSAIKLLENSQDTLECLYQGHILNLVKVDKRWEIIEHAPAVCILLCRGDTLETLEVLGVEQARPALGPQGKTWELPAGLIDEGESPLEAAQRELAEEVHLEGELSFLSQCYTSPGFCNEKIYIFEAKQTHYRYLAADEGEDLKAIWLKASYAWQAIEQGTLATSAPTCVALSMLLGRYGYFS